MMRIQPARVWENVVHEAQTACPGMGEEEDHEAQTDYPGMGEGGGGMVPVHTYPWGG